MAKQDEFKDKVFCKDCRFLRREKTLVGVGQVAESGVCISVTNRTPKWYGVHSEYPTNPSQQNVDNDCKWHKKRSRLDLFLHKYPRPLKKRM